VIPTWKGPETGGIFECDFTQEAIADVALHDHVAADQGAWLETPGFDTRLRNLNASIRIIRKANGWSIPVSAMSDSRYVNDRWAQRIWKDPRTKYVRDENGNPVEGWPGWWILDLTDSGTVAAVCDSFAIWRLECPADLSLIDELQSSFRHHRAAAMKAMRDAVIDQSSRRIRRAAGGASYNGTFAMPTDQLPDNGPGDSLSFGRMVQNLGDVPKFDSRDNVEDRFKLTRRLISECQVTDPARRFFCMQDTRPQHADLCMVVSLFVDGCYGITWGDFRQTRLGTGSVVRHALGRPSEYASGHFQKPILEVDSTLVIRRSFERGTVWMNRDGSFGVQVAA
jgi:hypothetical protein